MIRILYVDDDADAHKLLRISLPTGYSLISGFNGAAGLKLAADARPDVVLLDIDLPDSNGIDVLERIHRLPAPPPVIMITGYGEISLAVRAIRAGALDFIEKPYERSSLLVAIRSAARLSSVAEGTPDYEPLGKFIGESRAANRVRELVARYAPSHRPVLITGESGTGKDVVARLLHELSPRKSGPFVPRNCGAIPSALIESELFGSEKGGFTDAVSRPGSFESADSGTLFLDEIGEMPLVSQSKLLRVLEDARVLRVGAVKATQVDVRIVSATNRTLSQLLSNGDFRSDLYYRISTLIISIPPLRERPEDISLLVEQTLRQESRSISRDALGRLVDHPWPGNVRELHNVVERAAILSNEKMIESNAIEFGEDLSNPFV